MHYGILSLLPPLIAIALAIITKEVLISLFIGVFAGCMILVNGSPVGGLEKFFEIMIAKLSDPWSIQVILIVCLLGGLVGLLVRSGGSKAFGDFIGSKTSSRNGAQITTWVMGLIIFFDDYFNCLTCGAVMRPVSDKFKISREKLSYILDSTAVGVCLLAPVSSWVAFISSLIAGGFKNAGIKQDAFMTFIQSVPFDFYAWLSIIMVGVVVIFSLDFGPMAKAEYRTITTGQLCDATFSGGDADEDDYSSIVPAEGKVSDLLIPVIALIGGAFTYMLYTGGFFKDWNFMNAINNMNGTLALCYAIFTADVLAIILYKIRKLSNFSESMNALTVGVKSMVFVLILLAFAWSIGGICDKLDTGGYLAALLGKALPVWSIPVIIFLFSCGMAFATGASWGTYAVMMPLAIPLAINLDANLLACIAAVMGGGGFGNHCSPLADTAILSSAGANIRHIDHINTQIPYSCTCAGVAAVSFILAGFFKSPVIPLIVCAVLFMVVVTVLNRLFGHGIRTVKAVQNTEMSDTSAT